ncbi:MAG: enoyl-ACP reductase [Syntrophales bacterium]|nr:enoyl-ACP reductase [Syntrophales bacterium]
MANFNLKGKKAIIFGVANEQSIAWHIAEALNNNGVRSAFAYQERVEGSVKPLLKTLKDPIAIPCDVVDDSLLDLFFEKVEQEFGNVDFLVHSIAFAKKEHLQGKYFEVDRRGYQISQEVSAYSLTELTKRTYPIMNEEGSIITISYIGSVRVIPHYNVMGVCKAALEASVRYLSRDVGDRKIRINAISSGPIKTLAASGITDFEKLLDHQIEVAPLHRLNTADDVANLALFLCSDLSRNITGQVIYVDAGYNNMGL